ncbi:Trypanosome variant surface glycoprotein (A-type), putative [Trypanosoma equiperdum]|uniref:Trypanosome variant surface glycoprotein (A-type), putative n=1 Tax=Trypanosoma equiperdum TaxID=5694 RepID=A0A1G4I042_TRYEQ|nr:Trypanosome variant surface glycoprotein (A-type), putative [Trypanosoma equiperdum]
MLSQKTESAAGNAINHGARKPLCGGADKLAASATTAETNLQKSLTAQNSAIADLLKVMIYARRASGTDKKAARIAAAGLTQHGKITNTEMINGVKKTIDATAKASYLQGRIVEFLTIATSAYGGTQTHGCLENGSNRNAVQGTTVLGECGLQARDAHEANTGNNTLDQTSLYNNLVAGGGTKETGSTSSKCSLTNHNDESIIQDQTIQAPLKFAAGYTPTSYSSGDITAETKPALQAGITYTAPEAYKQAGEALIALMVGKVGKGAEHTRAKVATTKTVLAAKKLANTLILNKTSAYNDDTDGKTAEQTISTTLKDAENEVDMAIWEK